MLLTWAPLPFGRVAYLTFECEISFPSLSSWSSGSYSVFHPVCPTCSVCQQPGFLSAAPLSSCTHSFSCRLLTLPRSHQPAPTASAPASHCWATVQKAAWLGGFLERSLLFFLVLLFPSSGSCEHFHSSSVLISISFNVTELYISC